MEVYLLEVCLLHYVCQYMLFPFYRVFLFLCAGSILYILGTKHFIFPSPWKTFLRTVYTETGS